MAKGLGLAASPASMQDTPRGTACFMANLRQRLTPLPPPFRKEALGQTTVLSGRTTAYILHHITKQGSRPFFRQEPFLLFFRHLLLYFCSSASLAFCFSSRALAFSSFCRSSAMTRSGALATKPALLSLPSARAMSPSVLLISFYMRSISLSISTRSVSGMKASASCPTTETAFSGTPALSSCTWMRSAPASLMT